MKNLRLGQPPTKSHDWVMGNSATRGLGYTDEEIEFVKKNYLKYDDKELSKILGRTINGVVGLRSRKGLLRERKLQFRVLLRQALREAQLMRELWCITQDMKALITICELPIGSYKKEHYKRELEKLGKFNLHKIKPLKC